MRLLVSFFILILFVTGCRDNESGPEVAFGLRLSEKEVNEVQQQFNILQTEFEEVKATRNAISKNEQTDVGFLYMDILEGKLNTFDALLPNLNNLSVEDAVILMFFLMAEDAHKDLKDILEQIDNTNAKKKALLEKVSAWSETLSSFSKELNDIYLNAVDEQQTLFTDTTIALVNLFGERPASFTRSGQEGSVTRISVSSSSGQTPPIIFSLEDMATSEILFTQTISQNFSYSNTLKKKAALRINFKLNNADDNFVPVTVKIIHSKKVMKTPEAVNGTVGSVVRQLTESLATELEALYNALQKLYDSQFISSAEADAVSILATLSINHFSYASDNLKNPRIYKCPQKQEVISEMSEQDMYWLEKYMAKKDSVDRKTSEILKKISDTQNQITQNLK